jgi:hypothetical protein
MDNDSNQPNVMRQLWRYVLETSEIAVAANYRAPWRPAGLVRARASTGNRPSD